MDSGETFRLQVAESDRRQAHHGQYTYLRLVEERLRRLRKSRNHLAWWFGRSNEAEKDFPEARFTHPRPVAEIVRYAVELFPGNMPLACYPPAKYFWGHIQEALDWLICPMRKRPAKFSWADDADRRRFITK